MKTIGFIDYFLDEWHANNYPLWIEECNEKAGTDYKLAYAWAETDHPEGGLTTDEWCEKFGAVRCASIEELCAKSDCVIVLSPSNPEKHLSYAQSVFVCGKSPYIDKTFTDTFAEAEKIFALAKEHGVKFFSSSALRYSDELAPYCADARSVVVKGGGGTIEEYIIHQIEMAVKCLGKGASAIRYSKSTEGERAEVAYPDGRSASMTFSPGLAFETTVTDREGNTASHKIASPYFKNLISDILRFFDSGEISFDTSETLEVMKIRESVIKAKAAPGEWLDI